MTLTINEMYTTNRQFHPNQKEIEPDFCNAATFLCLACIVKKLVFYVVF
jgi:hypothetical protein